MGNCLNNTPNSPFDVSLLIQLKQRSLSEVIECLRSLMEDYPECQSVDISQFEDIFSSLVDDAEPFFTLLQNDGNIEGVVDVYEALAVFAIFSKDPFDKKVRFIFELFDFDHSNSLQLPELILTMQSVLRGLCKFVHITPPSHKSFEEEGLNIFKMVDHDRNERITTNEFLFWAKHSQELQSFLLKYAGIQTYENLKIKFDEIYAEYLFFFTMASAAAASGHAEVKVLREFIDKKEKGLVRESDLDFLMELLINTTHSLTQGQIVEAQVSKEAYDAVVRAWCCFMTSDLNRDNQLVTPELHALLWIYEEKEPNDERLKFEMEELAKNDAEGVTVNAWLKSLCVMDKEGKYVIRPRLKKLFERYDTDGSGYLSFEELKEIISETFKGYSIRTEDQKVKKNVEDTVSTLTKEILNELDLDGNQSIGWEEFKRFMDISWKKVDTLRKFLDTNLH